MYKVTHAGLGHTPLSSAHASVKGTVLLVCIIRILHGGRHEIKETKMGHHTIMRKIPYVNSMTQRRQFNYSSYCPHIVDPKTKLMKSIR